MRPDLEANVLAIILDHPASAPVALQHIGSQWGAVFSSMENSEIATAIQELLDKKRLPNWTSVRDRLAAGSHRGAIQQLAALRQHVEDPEFLEQRCTELVEATQLQLASDLAKNIALHLESGVVDVPEFIEMIQSQISRAAAGALRIVSAAEAAEQNWAQFMRQRENPGAMTGVPTGFRAIDRATHGLQFGKPYVLGARPSHGKTAIACNVADIVATAGYPVIIFAHEMDAADHTLRIAAARAKVDYNNITSGNLSIQTMQRYMAANEAVKKLPIWIVDDTSAAPSQCQAACHALAAKKGRGLIVVDYLQLERIPNCRSTRTEELALISQSWLHTIKRTRHAGLLLSQLNRGADGSRPKLSDLRDSGAIEQDAHGALLLWRPGKDDPAKPANQGHLMLAKNRNGPLAAARLHFTGFCMQFRDWQSQDTELDQIQMTSAEQKQTAGQKQVDLPSPVPGKPPDLQDDF
jgi:replicative DNA helicase